MGAEVEHFFLDTAAAKLPAHAVQIECQFYPLGKPYRYVCWLKEVEEADST